MPFSKHVRAGTTKLLSSFLTMAPVSMIQITLYAYILLYLWLFYFCWYSSVPTLCKWLVTTTNLTLLSFWQNEVPLWTILTKMWVVNIINDMMFVTKLLLIKMAEILVQTCSIFLTVCTLLCVPLVLIIQKQNALIRAAGFNPPLATLLINLGADVNVVGIDVCCPIPEWKKNYS